jgi:hypothetical protein
MGRTCSTHEEMRNSYKILVGKLEVTDNLEYLGVDGSLISKGI